MFTPTLPSGRRWVLLVLAVAVQLFMNLGGRGLNEPDEGRYAAMALETLEPGHDWLEPHMSDYGHFDKPPLIYLTTAFALRIFGTHEWAARLPSAMGALLTILGIGWVAFRLYGGRIAWWTVLFAATTVQIWLLGRFLSPDMLLTGWCTLAAAAWAESKHQGASWTWWCVMVLGFTLGWYTKATAALVPLLGLATALWLARDAAGLLALRPMHALVAILVLGSPWYLLMMWRHPELVDFFFGRELVGRVVGHPDGRHQPFYFHLVASLGAWAPWWPWMLFIAFTRRQKIMQHLRERRFEQFPREIWVVAVGLAVFSAISSKLLTYTLPFAPWAALLAARVFAAGEFKDESNLPPLIVPRTAAVFALLMAVATFIVPKFETKLGVGSSVKEAVEYLKDRGAHRIVSDRYMQGLEFYFGEEVVYWVRHEPRQLAGDTGECDAIKRSHFITPETWPGTASQLVDSNTWLLQFKARANSPLNGYLSDHPPVESHQMGAYTVSRMTPAVTDGTRKRPLSGGGS